MFLSNLFGSFRRTAGKPARRSQRRAFRPRLEQLEDRRLLTVLFADDFESGAPDWTAAGSDGLWNLSGYRSTSPGTAMHYGFEEARFDPNAGYYGGRDYDTAYVDSYTYTPDHSCPPGYFCLDPWDVTVWYWVPTANWGTLTSPAIDLTGVTSAVLQFNEWSEVEPYGWRGTDFTRVQVSADGVNFSPAYESYLTGAWAQRTVDLTPYAGGSVYVQFSFDTVDELYNSSEGWYIDDVVVYSGQQPPGVSISDVTVAEGNAGTTAATFTVGLTTPGDETVTVTYATTDGSATQAGGDYQATSGTLIFAAGETSKTITVLVNGDTLYEPDEYFFINLTSPTTAFIGDRSGTATIQNDDPIPPSLVISDVSVTEGNTGTVNAAFMLSLSAAYGQPVTVHYETANGSATAGSDYTAASVDIIFASGETSKTITIAVLGDRLAEPNENFFVNLTTSDAIIGDGQGVGTIRDNEPRITIDDVTKAEGKKRQTTLFTFTVTLSAAYDQPVTISFRTVDGTAATSDGDYVSKTGTLTFAPGETTKTITIEVKGDRNGEADETFYLDLFGNSSNALFTKNRGLGTILNDD